MAAPELPPAAQMLNMLWGFQLSQSVYVAAKLGIADALLEGPAKVEEIAERCGANAAHLRRLMRTLCALGVFQVDPACPQVYSNTALSRTLSKAAPDSVYSMALAWLETHYLPFGHLLDVVTGDGSKTGPELSYGKPIFDWYDDHPEHLRNFANAMKAATEMRAPAIDAFDPPLDCAAEGCVIADVGGGNGSVLASILASRPGARGIVVDRESTCGEARALMDTRGLGDRVQCIGGDFFASAPEADVYVLGYILHDWSDEDCRRILGCIRRAMKPTSVLAILETVVPEGAEMHMAKMIDITMLGMLNGQERSESEYSDLLASAGFQLSYVQQTPSAWSWVYAVGASNQ